MKLDRFNGKILFPEQLVKATKFFHNDKYLSKYD